MSVPPLAFFCVAVLARFPDELHRRPRRVPATPALLAALPRCPDPCLRAALAQLVHPLPPHLHELDLPLAHPDLPLLQSIPHTPDFSLLVLLALPHPVRLRDDDIACLRTLHRLLALDLRGSPLSSAALTRALAASPGTSPRPLRLLCLHGCPNIDNDALPVLHRLPLLSAVDLRFTRCTPPAVNASLSSLGFRPSDNRSLFHPASLALALCSLEKVALSAPVPISLYSCPPHALFRVYIDELDSGGAPASQSAISPENTVVFLPPLRKTAKHALPSKPVVSAAVDRPIHPTSNAASFYENAPAQNRRPILPLSALAVQSSEGGNLDPLAIARSPPPWKVPDTASSDSVQHSPQMQPTASRTGHTLSNPLKVDRVRLHKRGSDAVADLVHQFTSKRLKIESEFARAKAPVHSRNPFARSARSVFAESTSDQSRSLPHESSKKAKPDVQLRICPSLPPKTVRQQGTNVDGIPKPLKPITSLKPPILPKELLPSLPQRAPKPRADLKQTRLEFS